MAILACRPERNSKNTIETKTTTAETTTLLGGSNNCVCVDGLTLRNYIGTFLMIAGLAFGCLLLYSVSDPLKFLSGITINDQIKNVTMGTATLNSVLREATMEDNKTVILTTVNEAWAEPDSIFDLFLESFRIGNGTQGLLNNLVVVALDNKAYTRCLKVHPHCFYLNSQGTDFSGEANFMSSDYLQMMWQRIEFLRQVLLKGYDFIFTDTDIMWFRNPFTRFLPDGDFQIACDHFSGDPSSTDNTPNGGFTYVKSNNRTIQFYKFWYESRTGYPGKHDQDVLNKIKSHPFLSEIGLQMRFLDTAFFGGFCQATEDFDKVCTMHANCCVGLDNKIGDLKVLLNDWRNFVAGDDEVAPTWHVPKNCKGSFSRPHQPHKQQHHWRRLLDS